MSDHKAQPVLHVKGRVLVGPDDVRDELWVVGGRISYERPARRPDVADRRPAGRCPASSTPTAMSGSTTTARSTPTIAEKQALTDREAGTLLHPGRRIALRHPLDRRPRGPARRSSGPAGTSPAPAATSATTPTRSSPDDLVAYVAQEARRGDGWVKLVGDWIDRDAGDLTACWPRDEVEAAIAEAHRLGARVTAHCFAEDSPARPGRGGHRLHRARDRPHRGHHPALRRARRRDRPDAGQHRHVPAARGGRRGQVPALVGAYAAAARAPLRHRARGVRRRGPGLRRHRRGRLAGRTAWWRREVAELVKAGIPAAARRSRRRPGAPAQWLGRPGLEEGAPADLVVYDEDPRADVRVLAAPRRVVLNGRVVG